MIEIQKIMELLPHRYPMLLIDRILEVDPGKSCRSLKNVTINEAFFQEDYDEMVVVRDIELYSLCEHHLVPFIGKAHVAYIPGGKVVGLSKIARLVDRMAVILPFEEEIYRKAGLVCDFVGHPVFDEIREMNPDRNALKRELGLREDKPLVSLLPGSRPHEIDRLLPVLSDTIDRLKKESGEMQFCIPFAPNTDISKYDHLTAGLIQKGVIINKGESLKALAASDCAVIASGTASLQAVLLGVPAVVIYKLFPLSFWLGKLIIKVKHISLVNILSGREVVKELLQGDATPENIASEISRLMSLGAGRARMLEAYAEVRKMFEGKEASERVADMVIEMTGWKSNKR